MSLIEGASRDAKPALRQAELAFEEADFDAATIRTLSVAFSTAWDISQTADPFLIGALGARQRAVLAKSLIDLARAGLTDPLRLVDSSIACMRRNRAGRDHSPS